MAMMKATLLVSASIALSVIGADAGIFESQKLMRREKKTVQREKKQKKPFGKGVFAPTVFGTADNSWSNWLFRLLPSMGHSASPDQAKANMDYSASLDQASMDHSTAFDQAKVNIRSEPQGDQDVAHGPYEKQSDHGLAVEQSEEQVNHGFSHRQLIKWLRDFKDYHEKARGPQPVTVLEIGGEFTDLHENLRNAWLADIGLTKSDNFDYQCIDMHKTFKGQGPKLPENRKCQEYDGYHLKDFATNSKDLVVVYYVMVDIHDAENNRLPRLLREAARVSSGKVLVWEDEGGESEEDIIRRKTQREELFNTYGFRVEHYMKSKPVPGYTGKDIRKRLGRRMWILTPYKNRL